MDDLIGLLVIIGIGVISSARKRKKAQQKAAQKARAFQDAAEIMDENKKPFDAGEWKKFLTEMEKKPEAKPAAPKVKAAQPKVKASRPQEQKPAPAAKAADVRPAGPAPVLLLENDDPEGSISTQGESAEEHAKHRQKILAEEEQLRREHETLRELRDMNLEKLRTAVVMSEVLGKPVSLRRRTN